MCIINAIQYNDLIMKYNEMKINTEMKCNVIIIQWLVIY